MGMVLGASRPVSNMQALDGLVPASAAEGPGGVLDRLERSPQECNAVDLPGSAAAAAIG